MKNNTKYKIIEAAEDLFWLNGFASVSVDDICERAGVKKGSFYHYFESKNELIISVYEFMWEEIKPTLDACFSKAIAPLDRIKIYSNLVYERQKEKEKKYGKVLGCSYMSSAMELAIDEKTRQEISDIFQRFSVYFEELIKDYDSALSEKDVKALAQEMFSYVSGILYQARIKNSLEVIERDMQKGLTKLISGR